MRFFNRGSRPDPRPAPTTKAHEVVLPGIGSVRVTHVVDCNGENCPRPQLRTKKTVVQEMSPGEVMVLIVDNPSSPELVPTIMPNIGATHLCTTYDGSEWRLYIRKGPA